MKQIITTKKSNIIIEDFKTGGSFKKSLLKTVQFADTQNLILLFKSYPYLVLAILKSRKIKFTIKNEELVIL